jgi:predicted nucleic acid-binding protein
MIVVADTSAIGNLVEVGYERILPELFGEVFVPPDCWVWFCRPKPWDSSSE